MDFGTIFKSILCLGSYSNKAREAVEASTVMEKLNFGYLMQSFVEAKNEGLEMSEYLKCLADSLPERSSVEYWRSWLNALVGLLSFGADFVLSHFYRVLGFSCYLRCFSGVFWALASQTMDRMERNNSNSWKLHGMAKKVRKLSTVAKRLERKYDAKARKVDRMKKSSKVSGGTRKISKKSNLSRRKAK